MSAVPAESDRPAPAELPQFIEVIARVFFYACLAVFAIIVLTLAWRHRPNLRLRRPRRPSAVEFDALDDVAAAITADADAQRSALQRGAPRNAIVECWLLLEAAVVDVGVQRDPSDTSSEFTPARPGHRVRRSNCDRRSGSALPRSPLLGSSDERGVASSRDRSTRRRARRASPGRRHHRDEPMRLRIHPVAAIVGVTIAIDVLMVVTGMGPNVVLVAALGGLVGVGLWFLSDLADVAVGTAGDPGRPASEPPRES